MQRPLVGALLCAFFVLFAPFSHATTQDCFEIFEQVETLKVEDFAYPSNIVTKTLPSNIAASATVLTTAQILKHLVAGSPDAPIFSDAFLVTLPVDIILSAVSHVLGLVNIPNIKKLLDGSLFGKRFEFWGRSMTMAALGTGVIAFNWKLFGVPVNGETIGGAGVLCAAVYPILFAMKNFLFKVYPIKADRKVVSTLSESFPELEELRERTLAQAAQLGVTPEQAENMFLATLDGLVLSKPYEDLISSDSDLIQNPKLKKLIFQINEFKASEVFTKDPQQVIGLRRKIVNHLLHEHQVNEGLRPEIDTILKLSKNLDSDATLNIHRDLNHRSNTLWLKIVSASLVDQVIAVGVAGGVFLYAVNHWAATGEIPWFVTLLSTAL